MVKKVLTLLFCALILCLPGITQAGFLDDWISQHTSSGPDYLSGQERGYMDLGGFSARWTPTSDYLFSFSPPHIKAGCGGIDVFMGGFDFLKPKYLVQKFQRMLTAAPAVAFDMALSTLCEQCSSTLKQLESIASQLNQLQLNDCAATKAAVAYLLPGHEAKQKAFTKEISLSTIRNLIKNGVSTLYHKIKEDTEGKTPGQAVGEEGGSFAESVQQCPVEIKQVFYTTGSMLDHLAKYKGYLSPYVPLVRGLAGDIKISQGTGSTPQYAYIPPCSKNNSQKTIRALVDGDIYQSNDSGACKPVSFSGSLEGYSYKNLRGWVFAILAGTCKRMVSSQPLIEAEKNFLKTMPLSLYRAIKLHIQAQGPNVDCEKVASVYADAASVMYAHEMLADLFDTIEKILATEQALTANKGFERPNCDLTWVHNAEDKLELIRQDVRKYTDMARQEYLNELQQLMATAAFQERLAQAQEELWKTKSLLIEVSRGR